MPWNLDDNKPIYLQITERISKQIVSGVYSAGDKIPSVRELSAEAGVNPNTMQRALSELERSGMINTNRTSGRTVTESVDEITKAREELAKEVVTVFLKEMNELGYTGVDAISLLEKAVKEGK